MQKESEKLEKKAQSKILVVVLLILLVLVAVTIIWLIVRGVIEEKAGEVDIKSFELGADIDYFNLINCTAEIKITRSAGGGNIIGVKFVFDDFNGYSYFHTNTTFLPQPLESKVYIINLSESLSPSIANCSNIQGVSVYYVYEGVAQENRTSHRLDTQSRSSGNGNGASYTCTAKICADYAGRCGSALDNNCGGTINCSNNCENWQFCNSSLFCERNCTSLLGDALGCLEQGLNCNNDIVINCSLNESNGCYESENIIDCSLTGKICSNGECFEPVECTGDENCTDLPEISICNDPFYDYAPTNISICKADNTCTIPTQTISSSCNVSCNAGCDIENPCYVTSCQNQSDCVGNDYYEYFDVANNCSAINCSCESNICDDISIYQNDPRCVSAPVCGDAQCNGNETCSTCELDCGACSAQPSGLISHWKFDENISDMTPDEAGVNDGILVGGASIVNDTSLDNRGQVLSLDGADDYVDIPDDITQYGDAISISGWIYPLGENGVEGNDDNGQMIVDLRGDLYLFVSWVEADGSNPASIHWYTYDGSTEVNIYSSDNSAPINTWTHFVANYNGTDMEVYINGNINASGSQGKPLYAYSSDSKIGKDYGAGDRYWFNGLIDDIMIFNRSLSEAEIQQIYNLGTECSEISNCDVLGCYNLVACDPGGTGYDYIDTRGCAYNYNDGASCDTLYCKIGQTCLLGVCQGGTDRDCSDTISCTDDSCNEITDTCGNIINDSNCNYPQEICDVLLDCIVNPCYDITNCSDYSDSGNCSSNPCSVGVGCQWNINLGVCEPSPIPTTNNITQFGITWTFDKEYEYGTFANGDYWVVNLDSEDVTIIGIDPASVDISGRIVHGSMINPDPAVGNNQGYDNDMYGHIWNSSLNVARPNGQDLSASNNLSISPNSSLVSSISLIPVSAPSRSWPPYLKTAAVLTVLDSVPAPDSFRPAYAGTDKTIRFNKNQITSATYDLFGRLTPTDSTPILHKDNYDETLEGNKYKETVERIFERPWLTHTPGWSGGDYLSPLYNMNNYGVRIDHDVSDGALMLNLDYTNQEKETLLIRMVQLGIDNYGVLINGGESHWGSDGGHNGGKYFPIILAGLVLNDVDMKLVSSNLFADGGLYMFAEIDQTFYVTQADVDTDHSTCDDRSGPCIDYEQTDIGLPEWGIHHFSIPEHDNRAWNAKYRTSAMGARAGYVLASQIIGIKDMWNHDALFDYTDRYIEVSDAFCCFGREMWLAYRDVYGCKWTRDDSTDTYSNGFYNCFGDVNFTCSRGGSCVNSNCIEATSCSDYAGNQRACDYDPCGLGCGGVCGAAAAAATCSSCGKGLFNLCNADECLELGGVDPVTGAPITGNIITGFVVEESYWEECDCVYNPILGSMWGACSDKVEELVAKPEPVEEPEPIPEPELEPTPVEKPEPTPDPEPIEPNITEPINVTCIPVNEICNDNLDNDCDESVDCDDVDCLEDSNCIVEEIIEIPQDYVSYWKLDGNADDEKGVNNGIVYGASFVDDVERGKVASFDGVDDYIKVSHDSSLAIEEGTVSVWFKMNDLTRNILLSKDKTGCGTGNGDCGHLTMGYSGWVWPNKFGLRLQNDGNGWHYRVESDDSLLTLTTETWYHATLTFGSGGIKLYINGLQHDSNENTKGMQNNDLLLYIGKSYDGSYLDGFINDVIIYNRALSASEIQQIYVAQGGELASLSLWERIKGLLLN